MERTAVAVFMIRVVTLASLWSIARAEAAEFYLSASGGSLSNPGTRAQPLPSLEAVAASGRSFNAGDVLILLAGHHGTATIRGTNAGPVTVRPDTDGRVTLQRITLNAAQHWTIRGVEISPDTQAPFERVTMVTISGGSDNVLENCSLYTVPNAATWSAADWDTRSCNGISVTGTRHQIRGNTLRNVNFGITINTDASNCVVERNRVDGFSGDGIRGLGDYCRFEYNIVMNSYDVNANHDDAFQSWSRGPDGVGTSTVRGVVLRGNTFINYDDPSRSYIGPMQGIGCFDGFYDDWVIANNIIIVDHWHGITLSGARNCRIVNNTVIDRNSISPGPPWIRIAAHRSGQPSTGNLVRNNLATTYNVESGTSVMDHNLTVPEGRLSTFFVDAGRFDLHLVEGSPAIDAGSTDLAPSIDAEGQLRPADGDHDGSAEVDVGALESPGATPSPPSDLQTFTP